MDDCGDGSGEMEMLKDAVLVITSDRQLYERLKDEVGNNGVVHLVRPRKLKEFEDLPDIIDAKEYSLKMCGGGEETKMQFEPKISKKFISLASLEEEVSVVDEF